MQKTLSVRIGEKVTAFLEHTRSNLERSGEKSSTSEVARQMLDAIVEQKLPAGFVLNKRDMLADIIRAQRDRLPLTLHQYAFLADQAHTAYQTTSQDFVRADLLLNNLNAFEAVIKLQSQSGRALDESTHDRYFFANLGSRAQDAKNLYAAIECGRELIRELGRPFRSTGEFMSRNLEVVLRSKLDIPGDALDQALRPYLQGLLLLALKAFSYEDEGPVETTDNRHEMHDRLKIRAALSHRNEGFRLSFIDGNGDISAYLAPATEAWSLTCQYQRFMDLAHLIDLDRNATSEYFQLSRSPDSGSYTVAAKDAEVSIGLTLSESQMVLLRDIFGGVLSNAEYQRVFALLDLRYGCI